MSGINRVTVIGAGQIGAGLAQACARAGIDVSVVEPAHDARSAAAERISTWLASKGVDRAVPCHAELPPLDDTDLVVEATPERRDGKLDVLAGVVARGLGEHTIVATTTSAIPVTDLADAAGLADRLVGLHVFYPVPAMPVVEVITTPSTRPSVLDAVTAFIEGPLGKTAVTAPDRPGFIVNALVIPYVTAAVRLHEETGSSAADIDTLIRGAVGNPLGPLQLADFMGIDTLLNIARVLHRADPARNAAPPAVLAEMVAAGRLGRKSGQGFYEY